ALTVQRSSDARSLDDLRDRLEARYDIMPLSRGIALRSKGRRPAMLIEILNDGEIAIDGEPVSGRELRARLGGDADLILQLSYLDADQRGAFAGSRMAEAPHAPEPPSAVETQPDRGARQHIGERIAIFGSVTVDRDQVVDGQVVTVFGSSRIDGEVNDQVVAVFGSVDLGPESRVDGDVTVVGGDLRRAQGSAVSGSVREIGLGGAPNVSLWGMPWWNAFFLFDPFSYTARLMGTVFRMTLLLLLGSIALLIARDPVERIANRVTAEPLQVAVVGVLAELLYLPVLVLTCVILAITIIGILLLPFVLPFLIVGLLFVLLGGFVGAAYSVGRLAAARLGLNADQPYLQMLLGIVIIFTPLLLARVFAAVGGPMYIFAGMLAAIAFLIEYVVWTMGLGAALIGVFGRWRSTRRVTTDSGVSKTTDSGGYETTDPTDSTDRVVP
ncbi:MAG: hypothetical protein ACRD1S_06380, partial [Vicinamibacterales bacterium]